VSERQAVGVHRLADQTSDTVADSLLLKFGPSGCENGQGQPLGLDGFNLVAVVHVCFWRQGGAVGNGSSGVDLPVEAKDKGL